MTEGRIFHRGVPFGPDVDALMKAFPDLKPGDKITHETIEKVIREKWRSNRYRGVVESWRKRLGSQQNLELLTLNSVGFRVMSVTERIADKKGGLNKIGRATVRLHTRNGRIDTRDSSDEDKKAHNLNQRVLDSVVRNMQQSVKEIAEPSMPEPLPRLRPVG
jgi:hypothetical protein